MHHFSEQLDSGGYSPRALLRVPANAKDPSWCYWSELKSRSPFHLSAAPWFIYLPWDVKGSQLVSLTSPRQSRTGQHFSERTRHTELSWFRPWKCVPIMFTSIKSFLPDLPCGHKLVRPPINASLPCVCTRQKGANCFKHTQHDRQFKKHAMMASYLEATVSTGNKRNTDRRMCVD